MHTSKHVVLKYIFPPCIKCFSFIITSYDTLWQGNNINENNMRKIYDFLQLSLGDQIVTLNARRKWANAPLKKKKKKI